MASILRGTETASQRKMTQVYEATHGGDGMRLPYMNRSFISFSFGGKNIEDFGLIAVTNGDRIDRNGSSDFENLTTTNDVLNGQLYWGTSFKGNTLNLTLATDGITQRQLDDFLRWFRGGETRELILAEHPNRGIYARLASPPALSLMPFENKTTFTIQYTTFSTSTTLYRGEISLSFQMDEPFWHAIENIFGRMDEDTGIYYDTWVDANGIERNVFDSYHNKDVIKIMLEDGIPISSMIQDNMLLGNNILARTGDSGGAFIAKDESFIFEIEQSAEQAAQESKEFTVTKKILYYLKETQSINYSDVPEWIDPSVDENVPNYNINDYVSYNGDVYQSLIDDNAASPTDSESWERVTIVTSLIPVFLDSDKLNEWQIDTYSIEFTAELTSLDEKYKNDFQRVFSDSTLNSVEAIRAKVQGALDTNSQEPSGYAIWIDPQEGFSHYDLGTRVIYNGQIYESLIDNNTDTPGTGNWTTINIYKTDLWETNDANSIISNDIHTNKIQGVYMVDGGIEELSPGAAAADQFHFYYAGTAPAYPILEFTLKPSIDGETGYIISPCNSFKSTNDKNYNTFTIESAEKQEFKFTTPNVYTSYNTAIQIFTANQNKNPKDLYTIIQDNVKHKLIRAWAIKILDSYGDSAQTLGTLSTLFNKMKWVLYGETSNTETQNGEIENSGDILSSITLSFNSKTGLSTGVFNIRDCTSATELPADDSGWETYCIGSNIVTLTENVGDMVKSEWLVIKERNTPDENQLIRAWTSSTEEGKLYSYRIYHDVMNGLYGVKLIYNNMYV